MNLDFGAMLGNVAAMAAFSASITGWVRKHYLTQMNGVAVTGFAVLIAFATTGALVWLAHAAAWGFLAVAAFALVSGVFASGSIEVGKTFLGSPIAKAVTSAVLPLLEKLLPKGVTAPSGDPSAQATTTTTANPTPPSSTSSGA